MPPVAGPFRPLVARAVPIRASTKPGPRRSRRTRCPIVDLRPTADLSATAGGTTAAVSTQRLAPVHRCLFTVVCMRFQLSALQRGGIPDRNLLNETESANRFRFELARLAVVFAGVEQPFCICRTVFGSTRNASSRYQTSLGQKVASPVPPRAIRRCPCSRRKSADRDRRDQKIESHPSCQLSTSPSSCSPSRSNSLLRTQASEVVASARRNSRTTR